MLAIAEQKQAEVKVQPYNITNVDYRAKYAVPEGRIVYQIINNGGVVNVGNCGPETASI